MFNVFQREELALVIVGKSVTDDPEIEYTDSVTILGGDEQCLVQEVKGGERQAWEKRVLGQPVSARPLALAAAEVDVPLVDLPHTNGRPATVRGVRLPPGSSCAPAAAGGRTPGVGDGLRRGRWSRQGNSH